MIRHFIHRHRKIAVIFLALALAAVAAAAGMEWSVRSVAGGRVFDVENVPPAPVGIVFGAGLRQDGTPSHVLAGRLETARRLYAEGKVERLLVSGDNRRTDYSEPDAMRTWLIERGVPGRAVARDFAGRRTLDTCWRARGLWGVERAVLVTHDYHLPRSLFLARAAGIEATGVPAAYGRTRRAAWRERFARVAAWLDVCVFGKKSAVWGKPESWPGGPPEQGIGNKE